jgi:drug/metabolite transporter (DMT)-like permease
MKARYFIQLVMLSALWGASFILTRVAAPQLGPNVSAGLRMLLATVVLAAIMRALKHPWPTQHWRELLMIGFLAVAGPHLLYSWSALHLPGGYGALLSVTAVLFGAFTSAFLKEETLTRGKLTGCVLGLLGAALVVKLGPVEPTHTLVISALVCLGAAALSGTATPLLKRATSRMEPLSITAGMHAAAVLMLLPGALHDLPQAHFTLSAVAAVLVLGIATSGLAYWMFMRIIQHVPPMASMTANFMSTGFGVLWSVLLLDEPTSWAMAAGGGLIVLACLLVSNLNPLRALGALGAKLPPTPP